MKTIQSSVFRALCAIIVGVLLIEYREETVRWITILTGVIFFVSGVFSLVTYYAYRRHDDGTVAQAADGTPLRGYRPSFPIVGVGSVVLGAVLALMPTTFVVWITYIFATILILGAVNQMVALVQVRRIAQIGFYYWIAPTVVLLTGIVAVVYPEAIASAPLFIIGWCMLVYGATECVNAVKTYLVRRAVARAIRQQAEAEPADESAE